MGDRLFATIKERKGGLDLHLLGRVGRPEDVGGAVSFLASDDSSDASGLELFVNGGLGRV
jgi:NAD(P)-dependent dehydrogenase (short-subunit alcohol dehydrogenase family)